MGKPIAKTKLINAMFASTTIGVALLIPMNAIAAVDGDVLPDAQPGECYAKVLVPPEYSTETISSLISEASENILVVPAKFSDATEQVVLKDASTVITAIAPVYETVEASVVVVESSTQWVRGGVDSDMGASDGDMGELESAGYVLADAKPGMCFYEHYKPATIEKNEEKVLITEATETLEVIPASYTASTKEVLVRPQSNKYLAKPVRFKTVQEKILVEPAKSVWKKGKGLVEKIDNLTGEIMCRVEIPAVYKEFSRQVVDSAPIATLIPVPKINKTIDISVLDTDAKEVRNPVAATYETVETFRTIGEPSYSWASGAPGNDDEMGKHTGKVICLKETPAVIKTFEQTLVKTPGSFEAEELAAVYEEVPVQKLVSNAVITKTPIPAENQTFTKTTKIANSRLEWRPVMCETNLNSEIITSIQKALGENGYEMGGTPGVIDKDMFAAVELFQKDKNLAQGGLTISTIKALGVEL